MNEASEQFIAFNEQLAQLTSANLPVEYGLRLIAQDLRKGKLARQISALADQLEQGVPLSEAFAQYAGEFPPLYGRLIEAGVRSNNLSGMLMNLGRHLELMRRLRGSMWRTLTYPLVVLLFLAVILAVTGHMLYPQIAVMYNDVTKLTHDWSWPFYQQENQYPRDTRWVGSLVIAAGEWLPPLLLLFVVAVITAPLILRRLSRSHLNVERFTFRIPLVGPILVRSLISRWCDATSVAITSGMDLPGAMRLASEAMHSPALSVDADRLASQIESGQTIGERLTDRYAILPTAVPAAMQLAITSRTLDSRLHSLGEMYERQASLQVENLPAILSPILLTIVASIVGITVVGMTFPLIKLLDFYMRTWR